MSHTAVPFAVPQSDGVVNIILVRAVRGWCWTGSQTSRRCSPPIQRRSPHDLGRHPVRGLLESVQSRGDSVVRDEAELDRAVLRVRRVDPQLALPGSHCGLGTLIPTQLPWTRPHMIFGGFPRTNGKLLSRSCPRIFTLPISKGSGQHLRQPAQWWVPMRLIFAFYPQAIFVGFPLGAKATTLT